MSHPPFTMPEAKYRSTKKRVQPAHSIRTSEFAHERGALKLVPASAKSESKPETKVEAKQSGFKLASLWPVAVGILLAGFAPEWQALAAQAGVWVSRFAFPLAQLATHRELGIDDQMAAILPQVALYAQLPLDGLLTMLTLAQRKSLKGALAQLVLVHAICTFVLWLLSMNTN